MKPMKDWFCFIHSDCFTSGAIKHGKSWYQAANSYQHGFYSVLKIMNHVSPKKHWQARYFSTALFQLSGLGGVKGRDRSFLPSNVPKGSELKPEIEKPGIFRQFAQNVQKEPCLSRDWLVQLWLDERKSRGSRNRRNQRIIRHVQSTESRVRKQSPFQILSRRWFPGTSAAETESNVMGDPPLQQPPFSLSAASFLNPSSPEEVKISSLLARSNLLITRDVEWANLMLGFEQENRYAIVDIGYPQSPVGFIREQSNVIMRQLLRKRRPFIASITDAMGNELFRVRRPPWLINSTIYAVVDGKEIGVVHRRWHLWRRIYDLYLGNNQFAVVENPGFWCWTFTLKDEHGNVLAEIDRDWRGFGFELFTDAGQYVIRFGHADPSSKTGLAREIQELEITRPLTLSERAVAVALAVSLDNDYFSRHSGRGIPFIPISDE